MRLGEVFWGKIWRMLSLRDGMVEGSSKYDEESRVNLWFKGNQANKSHK